MSELKKKDNESLLQYRARLYRDKINIGLNNREIYELYIKETGDTIAESSCRCSASTYNQALEDTLESIAEDNGSEALQELEDKRMELEKEKVRLQDQKREYKALLRTDARFEHLVNEMKKSIMELNKDIPLSNSYVGERRAENSHAVLILSDWHFGIEDKNYWNEINIEIAIKRINKLKTKVIEHCKLHNVETLHIELLGDMINGFLHLGTRVSNEEDVIKQTMHCAEVLCRVINELSLEIPNIKVYSADGNHGRCSANKKESISTENFEKLIPWYMEGRLNNNVEIIDNEYEHDIIIYKFLNETIFAVHGHNDSIKSAISDLTDMFKIFPTELHMGHYHAYQEFDKHSTTTTVNGTLSGVDMYAKDIRKTSEPIQTLAIYNEDGRVCTYKIKVK